MKNYHENKMLKSYAVILSLVSMANNTYGSLILPKLCGRSSDALETVFQSTDSLLPGECTFELAVRPEICGIRIGLDTFSFNQPLKLDNSSAHLCAADLDLLRLTGIGLPDIELSVLCGELSGHHIHLPVKDYDELLPLQQLVTVAKKLVLTVIHVLVPGARTPTWNISLTQLPCQRAAEPGAGKPKYSLAPIGCLQFHDEKEGVIESLNFLDGLGHYLGNLNYAICFKRFPDTCGIEFVAIDFRFASNENSTCHTERDCDTAGLGVVAGSDDVLANKDYVIIPDGVSINAAGLNVYASKYCGTSLKNLDVSVVTQGPLYLGVVTDGRNDLWNAEIGFKIKYKLLTDCKQLLLL